MAEQMGLDDLFMEENERSCYRLLLNSSDVLSSLAQVTWTPSAPVDLRYWSLITERIQSAIEEKLRDYPSALASSKPGHASLLEVEELVSNALSFLKSIFDWNISKEKFEVNEAVLSLIEARNAKLALQAVGLFLTLDNVRPNAWRHRIISTRWFRTKDHSEPTLSNSAINFLAKKLQKLSSLQLDDDQEIPDDDGDSANVLKRATQAFDEKASQIADFSYELNGFALLMEERAKASPSFMARFAVLVGNLRVNQRVKLWSKASLIRHAFFVFFTAKEKTEEEVIAAYRFLEGRKATSAKTSALVSKIPGRGLLVESIRQLISEADSEFETKIGLSFARAAEKKSSKSIWLGIEAQIVLCAQLLTPDITFSSLLDGGIVRIIIQWLKHAICDEDESVWEEDDDRCNALTAAVFFFTAVAIRHPSSLQEVEDGSAFITGCHRLVVRLCSKRAAPSFGEKTILCALLWAMTCVGDHARRNGGSSARPPYLDIQIKPSPIRELLVMIVDNSLKLGSGVVRCAAHCLLELLHGANVEETLKNDGLGKAIVDFIDNLLDRCPLQDQEAIYSTIRYYLVILRMTRHSFGSGAGSSFFTGPDSVYCFKRIFETFRDPRFRYVYSFKWNDVGSAMRTFLGDAQDAVPKCVHDFMEALTLAASDDYQAWEQTLRSGAEFLHVRDVSKQFLNGNGLKLLLDSVGDREITQSTLQVLNPCVQTLVSLYRSDMLDAVSTYLCNQLSNPAGNTRGQKYNWIVWLSEIFLSLLSVQPTRYQRADPLIGNESSINSLQALGRWDAECEFPTRAYFGCLAQAAAGLPARNSTPNSLRSVRGASELALIGYFVECIEQVILHKPDRALARFQAIAFTAVPIALDDFLRKLHEKGLTAELIRLACEFMTKPGMGELCVDVLAVLTDPAAMKSCESNDGEVFWTRSTHEIAKCVLETVENKLTDLTVLRDDIFAYLVGRVLARIIKPNARSWRLPTKAAVAAAMNAATESAQAAAKPKEQPFKPDRQVVHSLMDMGFHVAHILIAQERLKTNELPQIASYLVENPQPVTEDDELKLAIWLSEEGGDSTGEDKEGTGNEAAKEQNALSPEELAEKEELDREENNCIQLAKRCRDRVLARCLSFGFHRSRMTIPWEAAVVGKSMRTYSSTSDKFILRARPRPPLIKASESTIFLTNESEVALRVISSNDHSGVVIVPPDAVNFPIHTYFGCMVSITPESDPSRLVGRVEAIWSDLELTVPRMAVFHNVSYEAVWVTPTEFYERPKTSLSSKHARSMKRNDSDAMDVVNESPLSTVVMINLGPEHLVASPVSNLGEKLVVAPGQTLSLPCKEGDDWFFYTAFRQIAVQFARIPSRKVESGTNPTKYVVMIPHIGNEPKSYWTMVQWLMQVMPFGEDTLASEFFGSMVSANTSLLSAVLSFKPEKAQSWIKAGSVDALLTNVWQSINQPFHHASPASTEVASPTKSSNRTKSKGDLAASNRKRMAAEAELMEESDQAMGENDLGKKKKKSPKLHSIVMCDSPARARALLVLSVIVKRADPSPNVDQSIQRVIESLDEFNVYEMDAAFTLLASIPKSVRVREVINQMARVGYFDSGEIFLEEAIERQEDHVFRYRALAYRTFRKLYNQAVKRQSTQAPPVARPTTNTSSSSSGDAGANASNAEQQPQTPPVRINLDTFILRLDLPREEHEAFSEAVTKGFLKLNAAGTEIEDCPFPELDASVGREVIEELLQLLYEHSDAPFATRVIVECCSLFPRMSLVLGTSQVGNKLLDKMLDLILAEDFSAPNNKKIVSQPILWLVSTLIIVAGLVPQTRGKIASRMMRALEETTNVPFVCDILVAILQVWPPFIVSLDEANLNQVVLQRLTQNSLSVKNGSSTSRDTDQLIRILKLAAKGESRDLVVNGISQEMEWLNQASIALDEKRPKKEQMATSPDEESFEDEEEFLIDAEIEAEEEEEDGGGFMTGFTELVAGGTSMMAAGGEMVQSRQMVAAPLGSNLVFPLPRAFISGGGGGGEGEESHQPQRRGGFSMPFPANVSFPRQVMLGASSPEEILQRFEMSGGAGGRNFAFDSIRFRSVGGLPLEVAEIHASQAIPAGASGLPGFRFARAERASRPSASSSRLRPNTQERAALRGLLLRGSGVATATTTSAEGGGASGTTESSAGSAPPSTTENQEGGSDVEMAGAGEEEKTTE